VNTRSKIVAVALLAVGVLIIGLGVRQTSSSARLKRYLTELRANGDKLTFTEIAIPPSTNAEHVLIASAYFIPSTRSILEGALKTEIFRRLAVTAIALKRYELRHGQAPERLGALVPTFLAAVPINPLSGKPLCFRTIPRSFVLYSVGEDGRDDGGQGGAALWNGPDALWPAAATPEDEPSKSVAGSTR
jgi:hypothetical protein